MTLKIRQRSRRGYAKEAQGHIGWNEWQLVDGRRVLGRFDLEEEAQEALDRMKAKDAQIAAETQVC